MGRGTTPDRDPGTRSHLPVVIANRCAVPGSVRSVVLLVSVLVDILAVAVHLVVLIGHFAFWTFSSLKLLRKTTRAPVVSRVKNCTFLARLNLKQTFSLLVSSGRGDFSSTLLRHYKLETERIKTLLFFVSGKFAQTRDDTRPAPTMNPKRKKSAN